MFAHPGPYSARLNIMCIPDARPQAASHYLNGGKLAGWGIFGVALLSRTAWMKCPQAASALAQFLLDPHELPLLI